MTKRFKDYSELTFTDDFMFCKVMSTNLDLCKEVLELILNMNISRIELAESQKTFDITAPAKSIRLDVYVTGDSNTVYEILIVLVMVNSVIGISYTVIADSKY